jgi:hypothetical protein
MALTPGPSPGGPAGEGNKDVSGGVLFSPLPPGEGPGVRAARELRRATRGSRSIAPVRAQSLGGSSAQPRIDATGGHGLEADRRAYEELVAGASNRISAAVSTGFVK